MNSYKVHENLYLILTPKKTIINNDNISEVEIRENNISIIERYINEGKDLRDIVKVALKKIIEYYDISMLYIKSIYLENGDKKYIHKKFHEDLDTIDHRIWLNPLWLLNNTLYDFNIIYDIKIPKSNYDCFINKIYGHEYYDYKNIIDDIKNNNYDTLKIGERLFAELKEYYNSHIIRRNNNIYPNSSVSFILDMMEIDRYYDYIKKNPRLLYDTLNNSEDCKKIKKRLIELGSNESNLNVEKIKEILTQIEKYFLIINQDLCMGMVNKTLLKKYKR
ncbi:uncharacterized protein LOC136076299 [Hydra vulgaris]|uniref:Uncharacterized protein LOC136076299 n=1 Tax=Hydra vulgaris TaxID=6087 RepID=A0ABM4BAB5_HYDVU